MTDREIFQANIKYYLSAYGKRQQDLADFVGVHKGTVSGWTRGVSYPRADVMERISIFFGIKLSDLVMERNTHQDETRLLRAWRNADPTYQTVALELLESHPKKEQEQSAI